MQTGVLPLFLAAVLFLAADLFNPLLPCCVKRMRNESGMKANMNALTTNGP